MKCRKRHFATLEDLVRRRYRLGLFWEPVKLGWQPTIPKSDTLLASRQNDRVASELGCWRCVSLRLCGNRPQRKKAMRQQLGPSSRCRQQGFTLVEIGVVLVIIGLLLGAVLKGQQMIRSAQVFNLAQAMTGYRSAFSAFEDRYRMIPGDSSAASTKVGNGAANCTLCCDNGLVDCWANVSLVNNHLVAAGFLSVPKLSAQVDIWPWHPSTRDGYLTVAGNSLVYVMYTGAFINTNGVYPASPQAHVVMAGPNLSSSLIAELDRKIDDGHGWTGPLRFGTMGAAPLECLTSDGRWIENNPYPACAVALVL